MGWKEREEDLVQIVGVSMYEFNRHNENTSFAILNWRV